jgi:hypothetical protein
MAKFDSAKSVFLIQDNGGQERDLSAYITNIDGLPGPRNLIDATTLGAAGHLYHPSLENSPFSIEGFYDDTATVGPDAVLRGLRKDETARTFKYGAKGLTAGFPRETGTCFCSAYTKRTQIGNLVGFRADFQVSGAVTHDTF